MLKVICLSLVLQLSIVKCGLLGYGTGEGSCAAPPFRAYEVQHAYGCPPFAPCCSEFGFCRPLEEWDYGKFRDCNGVSNGTPLLAETIAAEEAAGPHEGKPAGEIGPPPDVIREHYPAHKPPHHPPHPDPHAIPHPAAHHAHHAAPHPLHHHAPQPPHPHPAPHTPVHHAHHPPPHHAGPHSPHIPHLDHHISPHPAPHHASHHVHHPIHPHPPVHAPHHVPSHHVHHALNKPIHAAEKTPTPYLPPHPEPKHHNYLAPEPHKPAYTAPEVHHPSYGAPKPHHPSYGAPEPHHPTYVAPPPHPTYVAPEPHHPTYGAPEPHHPTYGAPEPHHPTYLAPESHPPAYNAPQPHHSVYPAPVHAPLAPTHISHKSHHLQHGPHHHNLQPHHPTHPDPHHSPIQQIHQNTHHLQHAHQFSLGSHHQPHHLQIAHGTHQIASHVNLSPHIGHSLQSPHHPLLTSSHVQPAPPHPFTVHSPAPVTHINGHVSPFQHALEPVHHLPAKSSSLSHSPFVSFGSSSAATKEPSLVNTVQLRMGEKAKEIATPSITTSVETRKPKAFESENPFKTSPSSTLFTTASTQEVQVSVTSSPTFTTPRTILQSNTAESGAFVSFAQQTISEPKPTSLSESPTKAQIIPIQTFRPSTNMFSTPRPTAFSTIGSLNTISKSVRMGKEEFVSFGQNSESPSSPTPKPDKSISTLFTTSTPFISSVQPFNLPTTRQPRVLQAVTPLVNIFASTPSPTILPNPTINLGSESNAQKDRKTALATFSNPLLALSANGNNLGESRPSFAQPSPVTQVRVPSFAQQNAVLSLPVESKSQQTTQCQHPKGSGSYTCISFGVHHNPIFAFHTVQGDDGFFFGTGSGFPEHKIVNGPATIRRRRKLQKNLIQKELARIKKEKKMRAMEDMQEEESSSIYISPEVNNKLPITSYQKKLLERSESEKIFKKANKNKSRNAKPNNADIEMLDMDANIMLDAAELQETYQTDFISEEVTEMQSNQKPVYKTVTTPKVQLYEYPVEETISYLTIPSAPASLVTTPSSFSEPESHSKRQIFLTETPRRPYPSSYESLSQNKIDARNAESFEP